MVPQKETGMTDQLEPQELEKQSSDTEPPPTESHGFLEQFEAFAAESLSKLEALVIEGLTPSEKVMMCKVALKFCAIAFHDIKEEDFSPEDKQTLEALVLELESRFPQLNT